MIFLATKWPLMTLSLKIFGKTTFPPHSCVHITVKLWDLCGRHCVVSLCACTALSLQTHLHLVLADFSSGVLGLHMFLFSFLKQEVFIPYDGMGNKAWMQHHAQKWGCGRQKGGNSSKEFSPVGAALPWVGCLNSSQIRMPWQGFPCTHGIWG